MQVTPKGDLSEDGKRAIFNLDSCRLLLLHGMKNTQPRLNVITGDIDILNGDFGDIPPSRRFEALITLILSDHQWRFTKCTESNIRRFLEHIAVQDRYNPVLEAIKKCKWDGRDRFADVYAILGIPESDTLSRTLVRKWFHQGIVLLDNSDESPVGADGVLVLDGGQGIGKTSFFRKIAINPGWFRESGRLDQYDKDTERWLVTVWIAEFGELETTLRGDIERIKGFITNTTDKYRPPYARTDVVSPRRANLGATCNTTAFLKDQTGNRRFWTVPVGCIDLGALEKLDALQLWAQVYRENYNDKAGFRLTPGEREQLEQRNGEHLEMMKGEGEIRDILASAEPEHWQDTTVANFKANYEGLRNISVSQIGKVLTKLGIPEGKAERNGKKVDRFRRLPILDHYAYRSR